MRTTTPARVAFGARMKAARVAAGMTQQQMAKALGVSQQSITAYERGDSAPRTHMLEKLASILGISSQFLLAGAAIRSTLEKDRDPQAMDGRVSVRLTIKMSAEASWITSDAVASSGTVEFHSNYGPAYAIRVTGDALHPRVRSGEFIIVEPGAALEIGDEVLVSLHNGTSMIRELLWRRDGQTALMGVVDGSRLTLQDSEILEMMPIGAIIKPSRFSPPRT